MECAGHPIPSERTELPGTSLKVSPELQSLVMSMLDANPSARPSAEEVNQQVAQLWSKDPIDTKMDTTVSPAQVDAGSQATSSGEQTLKLDSLDIGQSSAIADVK